MTKSDDLVAVRDRILVATLPHAAFDGWSRTALRAGVDDAGREHHVLDQASNRAPGSHHGAGSDERSTAGPVVRRTFSPWRGQLWPETVS